MSTDRKPRPSPAHSQASIQTGVPAGPELERLLEPGDVILTCTEGYVSNLFLPGAFKHGIVYVGSPQERRALESSVPAETARAEP